MKYRTNIRSGEQVSLLGFGMMRLPTIGGDLSKIDEKEAISMLRYAIDSGVNYVDTAYAYHGGNSETVTGKALKDGYREKVSVATKLPLWDAKKTSDLSEIFETQLKRLDMEYIDYYLVHSIEDELYETFKSLDVYDFVKKAKDSGKVKKIGFSYHGSTTKLFKELLDDYDWDFAQIQFNFMDENTQAGLEGLRYAGEKEVPVIIMEPLKGGLLSKKVPDSVKELYKTYPVKRSPAEWAFRWVAEYPEVLTILSGMSTMTQVEENIKILSADDLGTFTDEERDVIAKVISEYECKIKYACTGCKYCLPCQEGLDIPGMIELVNNIGVYDCFEDSLIAYKGWVNPKSIKCSSCGKCLERCPQKLKIPDIMAECSALFDVVK